MNVGLVFVTVVPLALLALGLIAAVMFSPEEPVNDDTMKMDLDQRSCVRPAPVPQPDQTTPRPQATWDEVDSHWGEANWMLVTS